MNHPNPQVQGWAKNAYESARSAYLLKRNKMVYDSLYLAHLAVEKALKAKMIHDTGKFEYGHNLTILIKKANLDQIMPEWMQDFCASLNLFQTTGRYPEEKKDVIENIPHEFLEQAVFNAEKVIAWIMEQMKSCGR